MAGFGTTPVTTGAPVGTPLGSVAVEGHAGGNLTALRGVTARTDSNGNETAAVAAFIENGNANGQNVMANSSPVAIANDQTPLPLGLYSASGPVDKTGKSQTSVFDKLASLQGKFQAGGSGNITATAIDDVSLVFGAAPKTIVPGQKVQLSIGSGNALETVIVSTAYVPSSTATTIPLQYPVVLAGSTTAKWDTHNPLGPAGSVITTVDIGVVALAITDPAGSGLTNIASYGGSDGQGANKYLQVVQGAYNGTSLDKVRNNLDAILLASAARTTTQTSADIVNYNGRGIKVWLDMTVVGTGSVTLTINAKDPASGKYLLLLSGVAVVTNITSVYTIYPNIAAVTNVSLNDILPRTLQIVVTANNANTATYSVGYSIIV